jgi:hypothetical protein
MVKYCIKQKKIKKDDYRVAVFYASKKGHLDIIKYIQFKSGELFANEIIRASCENGHMDVIQYFIESNKFVDLDISSGLYAAMNNNYIDIIMIYIRMKDFYLDSLTKLSEFANENCSSDIVQLFAYLCLIVCYKSMEHVLGEHDHCDDSCCDSSDEE